MAINWISDNNYTSCLWYQQSGN